MVRRLNWIGGIVFAMGMLGSTLHAEERAKIQVGVIVDPCAAAPKPPKFVVEVMAALKTPEKRNQPLPEPTATDVAEIKVWKDEKLLNDYPDLCQYEAANTALAAPTPHRIVLMGDSITEGWSWMSPSFFSGGRINRGISGQTSGQMLGRFQADVIALHPASVHILAGTNDLAGNTGATSIARIANNIRSMVDLARAHRIKVVLATVLPVAKYDWRPEIDAVSSVRTLNEWIRHYARSKRIVLVDYFAALDNGKSGLSPEDSRDGVHPTATGYAKMEAALRKAKVPGT
jgi:acyl-CoA thioesterase I